MPAAAHDAPRPGALSTTVTPRPAWAARQAMPRPITPPPTTTTSLVPASAALVLIRATLPSPALPGAGSDGRRRTAALSARWHPGSRVAPAYASRWPRGHGSAPGHGRRGPIGCSSGQPLRTPVTCAASRDPRCAPCGAPPPQVIPGAAPVHDRRSLVHVAVAGAGRLVAAEVELADGLLRAQQRDPAAGDDALLDGGPGGRQGVLDAVLLLLELDLGGRADADDRDAAGQLGQALLELLAVPI